MTARTATPTAETVTANLDLFRQFSALFRQKYPAIAGACNGRLERAERIAATPGAITPASDWPDTYYVKSESNPRTSYRVNVKERSCTCPDHGKSEKAQADGRPAWICKHRLAVGLAVRGPEWQRERLAAELHTARAAMRAAWQAVIDLTDAFENLDPGAPEIDQAHAAMLAAAERAEQLDAHYRQAWQSFEARRHVVTA